LQLTTSGSAIWWRNCHTAWKSYEAVLRRRVWCLLCNGRPHWRSAAHPRWRRRYGRGAGGV